MRLLERNKQTFYYSLLLSDSSTQTDTYGNPLPEYGSAVAFKANISAARGYTETEQFGTNLDYDRIIVTEDMSCPIDEHSILFIGIDPSFDSSGKPLGNYFVKQVARSLNNISYAISKVDIS